MSYYSQELSCILPLPAETSKPNLEEWIQELSASIYHHHLLSGELPEHFESIELEIPSDPLQAERLIGDEICRYVRWIESVRAEDSSILVLCEDDTEAADVDWFLRITSFLSKKSSNSLPGIRSIKCSRLNSSIENLILLEKDGSLILKTQEDLLEALSASENLLTALL
jgi:hypothetical protein